MSIDPSLAAALRAEITARRDALIETTRAFTRIDSQTPPSATGPMARAVFEILSAQGVTPRIIESEPPVVNVLAEISGRGPGPRLVLNGHLDTYPIGDPSGWTIGPLSGELREGRIYGRGAADMKGGIAAQIEAALALARRPEAWDGTLVLAFAGDEESMGVFGTQALLDTEPAVRGDAALIADVGAPEVVRCGEKGMIWLRVMAEGRAAHGAHTHRGINAAERLMAALAALRALEELPVDTPQDAALAIAASDPVSDPLGGPGEAAQFQRVTVNIGRVAAGISANLVPDRAEAELDVRLPLGAPVARVEAEIMRIADAAEGVSVEITRRYEPSWTDPSHPIVEGARAAAEAVLARPAVATMRVGASDARLFRAAGIATAVCGLTPYGLGGPDEHCDVEELPRLAEIHARTALGFLGAT